MRLSVLRVIMFDTRAPPAKCTGPPSFQPASSSETRPPHAPCPLSQEAADSRPPQHAQGSPWCMSLCAWVCISLGACWKDGTAGPWHHPVTHRPLGPTHLPTRCPGGRRVVDLITETSSLQGKPHPYRSGCKLHIRTGSWFFRGT